MSITAPARRSPTRRDSPTLDPAELDPAELDRADRDPAEPDAAELDAAEFDAAGRDPAPLDRADPLGSARQIIAEDALRPSTRHRVGLELEFHLVDLEQVRRRPDWSGVQSLLSALPVMPVGSRITVEPGGQLELSTVPHGTVEAAVAALRTDSAALRAGLRTLGFGAVPLGSDPARRIERVNPHPRYAAMEQHFRAHGHAAAGRAMMTATAALQVNLDAGPVVGWSDRLARIRALVPILIAASSTSPYLAARSSGWHSMRQETWHGIDPGRSGPVATADPAVDWADYALAAPVLLINLNGALRPVTERVTFGEWLGNPDLLGRAASRADLDYHLTTLFPPVRPRGYIEIRCIDALPDRWWPAMAAIAVTLIDDPVAAAATDEVCEPVAHEWASASRRGLAEPAIRTAVRRCLDLAARRCPGALRAEVEAFAELIDAGRSPSGELRGRIEQCGPYRVLEEESSAS
ncbi:MAG: ergothioneine biosynthesis glutamate--cysteine ligase EgtA [Nocardioides sp.]